MSDMRIGRRSVLGLGAGMAAVLSAPSVFAQAKRPATFNWTLHKPEEVGMSRAGLDKVKAVVQKYIDKGDLTGAVSAIARRNKLVHYEAQGLRNLDTKEPMQKDDMFRMMSSTKPLVGVSIMMMQEEGKLSVEDKVSRFIPEFSNAKVAVLPDGVDLQTRDPAKRAELVKQVKLVPANRDITIRDLLTHTSGLSSGGAGQLFAPARADVPWRTPGETLATYVPTLGALPLDFQPGSRWQYSASDGVDVLLRIVEIASKTPADVFLRERIFEPLDMRDTYFNVPPEKQAHIIPLYTKQDGQWKQTRAQFGNDPVIYFSGGGGTLSTAHDRIQFEEMLLNKGELNGKRVLKAESVTQMSSNQTGDLYHGIGNKVEGTQFGFTVRVMKDPVAADSGRLPGAFGWYGAYGTITWTDPADEMTVALMIQQPILPALLPEFEHAIRNAVVA